MTEALRRQSLSSRVAIPDDSGEAAAAAVTGTSTASPATTTPPSRSPAAASSSRTATFDLSTLQQARIRSATAFRGDGGEPVDAGGLVSLSSGDILSVRSNDVRPIRVESNGNVQTASPTLLYAVDDAGTARELALVHRTHGLSWNPARRAFMGTLLVGIIDRASPRTEARLPQPIPVQLLAAADAVDTPELAIEHIGGRFKPVGVTVQAPDDPFVIGLVSPIDPDLPAASLALRRLPVTISGPTMLDGFGLGEGVVTVRAASGRLHEGESLTLHLDNGVLDESILTVGANGIASTRVRSVAGGSGTVELIGGPYRAEPWRIRYGMPWLLLAATLAGAMLGATIFVYAVTRSSEGTRGDKRRATVDWLVGCAVGIGATAMVYAGMDLPDKVPMPRSLVGAIVPFAVGFVCAAMGAALIHFLTGFRVSREDAG